jgi:hypothetical protein
LTSKAKTKTLLEENIAYIFVTWVSQWFLSYHNKSTHDERKNRLLQNKKHLQAAPRAQHSEYRGRRIASSRSVWTT